MKISAAARLARNAVPWRRIVDRAPVPVEVPRFRALQQVSDRNLIATGGRTRNSGRALTVIVGSATAPTLRNRARELGRKQMNAPIVRPPDRVPAGSSAGGPAAAAETRVRIEVAGALVAAVLRAPGAAANREAANALNVELQ